MKLTARSVRNLFIAIGALSTLASTTYGAVIFALEPITDYLTVTFTEDITFTFTSATGTNYVILALEDVYSSEQAPNWGNNIITSATTLTLKNPTDTLSNYSFDGGILSYEFLDLTDIGIPFNFTSGTPIAIGDTAVLSAGTFSFGKVMPLPDNTEFTASLGNSNYSPITAPESLNSVPEPSSVAFLFGLGAAGIAVTRKKRRHSHN